MRLFHLCLSRFFVLPSALLTFSTIAGTHEHGIGNIKVAVDNQVMSLELMMDTETAFGFEHQPNTMQEKEKVDKVTRVLTKNLNKIFVIPNDFSCRFKREKMETFQPDSDEVFEKNSQKKTAQHFDFIARFNVACVKAIKKTTLTVNFEKIFPRLKSLNVVVNSNNGQYSKTMTTKNFTIDLP